MKQAPGFGDRVSALLGEQGIAYLARALRCSEQRFKYEPTRPIVLAVVELLELMQAHAIPEMCWPPRWLTAQRDSEGCSGLRDRYAELLGSRALTSRLALALEVNVDTLRKALAGRDYRHPRAQTELIAVVELLEVLCKDGCAPESWPPRWQRRREPSGKTKKVRPPFNPDEGRSVRARVCAVLGNEGPIARLARALETKSDSFGRTWRGERDRHGRHARVRPSLLAVVELLETLKHERIPVERWPERWRRPGGKTGRPRRQQPEEHAPDGRGVAAP